MQRVQIQAVKPRAAARLLALVPAAEPVDERHHHVVAPHPARKPDEVAKRFACGPVAARQADPSVDAVGVGPIGLHGQEVESAARDQRACDLRTSLIELMGAVRRFTDQDDVGVGHTIEQRVGICAALNRNHGSPDDIEGGVDHGSTLPGAAAASWSAAFTSSSVVWLKFSYHAPTAPN